MISVIYCTRKHDQKYIDHLKFTSGLRNKIEIIEIVNEGESLSKAYNRGLEQCTNDIVVLCHDDIIFNKNGWARNVIKHFNESDYGILGVAGTTDLDIECKWWSNPNRMVGTVKHSNKGKTWENKYSSNFGNNIIETVIVDGLFIAINKQKIKKTFDETVEGFHFYDIDFCLKNYLEGVKIGVMFDIKLTHKSIGETNDEWEKNRLLMCEKYKNELPINIIPSIEFENKNVNLKVNPKVTVIIPTKSKLKLLFQCIESIFEKDNYSNLTVIIADTGSSEAEIKSIQKYINTLNKEMGKKQKIILVEYDYYNYAKINNDVVTNHVSSDTDLLLFCNNDIMLLNNAITQMVNVYLKNNKTVGTIGGRLYYEDNSIQHSGISMSIINQQGGIGLSHKGLGSYFSYSINNSNVFGNTAALMLTSKDLFNKLNGFNENYLECFEDVEYNIECLKLGKKNIIVGEAVAYHYESQTRNESEGKAERQNKDLRERILPKILKNKITWNYFENIKSKVFEDVFINRNHVNQNQHTN